MLKVKRSIPVQRAFSCMFSRITYCQNGGMDILYRGPELDLRESFGSWRFRGAVIETESDILTIRECGVTVDTWDLIDGVFINTDRNLNKWPVTQAQYG